MKNLYTYDEFLFEKKWDKSIDTSSHITNIKYDDKTKTLEIEFYNGAVYQYENVPKKVFRSVADERTLLGKAGKKIKGLFKKDKSTYGTRFWKDIRRGNYKYKKIKG